MELNAECPDLSPKHQLSQLFSTCTKPVRTQDEADWSPCPQGIDALLEKPRWEMHSPALITGTREFHSREQREWASPVDQLVKNPPAMQKVPVRFLAQEAPLEKG